jgi:hypothetical protein
MCTEITLPFHVNLFLRYSWYVVDEPPKRLKCKKEQYMNPDKVHKKFFCNRQKCNFVYGLEVVLSKIVKENYTQTWLEIFMRILDWNLF